MFLLEQVPLPKKQASASTVRQDHLPQLQAAKIKKRRSAVKRLINSIATPPAATPAPAAISKTETTTPAPPAGTDTPVPTDYETEARAEAEEYYWEILEEKRRAAGGSASSASSETKPA